jgi:hypothetical protein
MDPSHIDQEVFDLILMDLEGDNSEVNFLFKLGLDGAVGLLCHCRLMGCKTLCVCVIAAFFVFVFDFFLLPFLGSLTKKGKFASFHSNLWMFL